MAIDLRFAPRDVDEEQHSAHSRRRIDVGVEQFVPGCRAWRNGLLEVLDPKLPEDIDIAGVDREQRTVALGAVHQRPRDAVVVLHNETENPVGMFKVLEDRLLIRAAPYQMTGSQSLGMINSGRLAARR